ncbi:MAG: fumarylacetoacetate hydrolase family protein [Nitrososphaerota archaeon]|nr:fumarylacetoacetate hydrolase family protein [Nitrososphaerota archaeon]
MKICSFSTTGNEQPRLGMITDNTILDLTALNQPQFNSFYSLLRNAKSTERSISETIRDSLAGAKAAPKYEAKATKLNIPLVPTEVWGAGITYKRSREAREVETALKGLYNYLYDSERPEIFFKANGTRCVGPGDSIGIRSDSKWTVPEPELSLVLDSECRVIGYTIGDDVSARDIEGTNPLYLPQAKIFSRCCAVGPVLVTPEELTNPGSLGITMTIYRDRDIAFQNSTSTSQLKRSFEELTSYLRRDNVLQDGTILMTGTGIVPPDDFSLKDGDLVDIEIEGIGALRNKVLQLPKPS